MAEQHTGNFPHLEKEGREINGSSNRFDSIQLRVIISPEGTVICNILAKRLLDEFGVEAAGLLAK